jgi:ribosomal peptide maturation radical SAM protein 1
MKRVLLINMPFAGAGFPSLALGLFKARLERDGIPCDVRDLNVVFAASVGWDRYNAVGQFSALLAGEQMFAQSLFGAHVPPDAEYRAHVLDVLPAEDRDRVIAMKRHVEPFLQHCMASLPWDRYDIVGFSSLFEQNVASLSLACRIKQRFPGKTIVFGGANCEDVMGVTMHRCFPFVDFVCTGEADRTFPELVQRLRYRHPVDDLPGLVYRSPDGSSIHTGPAERVKSLDELPFPDYDDYFRTLRAVSAPPSIDPQLLFETSRGCWWGEKAKCTFCGLNGQILTFRAKSAERALDEIRHLTSRYGTRFLRAVDNIMAESYFVELLPRLEALALDVDFFYEVTPNLRKEEVAALARARVNNVQAGIENVNSHILRLMRKGTTALKNVEFLRWCEAAGVYVDWNLLFGFPGETADDYVNAYELAGLLTHLKPPTSVGRIRLDRFSDNFDRAHELGLKNIRPWGVYRYVYPFPTETLQTLVYFFDFDYVDERDDRGYLGRVTELVSQWQSHRVRLDAWRVNGQVVIADTRTVGSERERRLDEIDGWIYEFCDRRRTVLTIRQWLQSAHGVELDLQAVQDVVDRLVEQKLMIVEKGLYLSLAVMRNVPADADIETSGRAQANLPVVSGTRVDRARAS